MIEVNEEIMQAYKHSTIQIDRIKINNNFYAITNVVYSDDCYDEGNVFGTAMGRILTFDIESSVEMEKNEFEYQTGIVIEGAENYISLGNFIVIDAEEGDTTDITHVTAIDYMLKTNILYETHLNYSTATLLDVLQEVCDNCGILLATTTFTNSDFRVDSNQFESNTLCREVIQAVAQVSGTIAKIKADNKLYLINPNQVSNVSQVFDTRDYAEADIKRLTHPINVVSLTESEFEGENVTMRDEESIAQDGENSIIINDNPFAYNQDKRTQLITGLFNAIKGFEYKSYALKFQMLPWVESLDKIQLKDSRGNPYNSFVFRFEYHSPDGLKSTIEAPSLIRATINYQNIPDALEVARRTEIIVDKQNQVIESVVSNVDAQNTKISRVEQTVDELNSKISDIADITTSQETNTGRLLFDDINESEPIRVEIRPLGDNISYLYPFELLFPANDLYIKLRTLRFTNTETNEVFDYELPDDLLYYDDENYDEFILDYDAQTCQINKKCGYNNNGQVVLLSQPRTDEYTFPHIELTDGDYKVEILKYDNVPYGAYLFCRLMAQNIYTTQFATKAELNSEISQTAQSIDLSVDEKLSSYSTTSEMNSAISLKANEISSSVSEAYATKNQLSNYSTTTQMNSAITQKAGEITSSVSATYETKSNASNTYATKTQLNAAKSEIKQTTDGITSTVSTKVGNNEVISKINQSSEAVTINANKINLAGKTINLTSDNIAINSTNFKVDKNGNMECNNAKIKGNTTIEGTSIALTNPNYSAFTIKSGANKMVASNYSVRVGDSDTNHVEMYGDATYGNYFLRVEQNGVQTVVYSTGVVTTSKEELKKNFEKYENALEKLKEIDIYKYNFKSEDDETKKHIGFVIGDKYKYSEEVTSADNSGVDLYSFVSLCCQAIKEQQEEIEKLKKRLEETQNG